MEKEYINVVIDKEIQRAYSCGDMFLQHGMIGISLFLYSLYKITKDERYLQMAHKTLDDVCKSLKTNDMLNIPNGLSGIALSLLYLVKMGYVTGNISHILQDIDDHIYRTVASKIDYFLSKEEHKYEDTFLDIIIYTSIRLTVLESTTMDQSIRERFLMELINAVYREHNMDFYNEPFPGSFHYKTPKFLIALSLSGRVKFCHDRICHILEECEHVILSKLPYLGFNRLYLYVSMLHLKKNFELNRRWLQFMQLLERSISVEQIIEESPENNLFFSKGLIGVSFLLRKIGDDFPNQKYASIISKKIESSVLFIQSKYSIVEMYNFHGLDGILGLILYDYKKTEKKDMNNLTDTTFLIPIRIDSIERLENLMASIRSILNYAETHIKVLESGSYNNHVLEKVINSNVDYSFVEDHDLIFHRTHYLNILAKQCSTPYIVIWDADVIIPPDQLVQATTFLRKDIYDIVLPYDGRFYDTTKILRELYVDSNDLTLLTHNTKKMLLPYGSNMGGGAIFIKREQFWYAGGEDERFYGWGPEDWNRLEKWKKLGLTVGRVNGPLFHLPHPRDINGTFSNALQRTKSFYLLRRNQMSSAKEIQREIKGS